MQFKRLVVAVLAFASIGWWLSAKVASCATATPWVDQAGPIAPGSQTVRGAMPSGGNVAMVPGAPVDMGAALVAASNYLKKMQADVTEDNAGNGSGVAESPNDPDDGGWDWAVTSPPAPFFHTIDPSYKNLYGVSAIGLYDGFVQTGNASYFTAMTDAANVMMADAGIRSASDLIFLMLYNDLPGVAGTAYKDAAKAKFDSRIATYGTATGLAQAIRDARAGQGLRNGIIAWDIGAWAKAAAMLRTRYPGDPYNYMTAAADIAEVLWQDTFNANPGYFDLFADAGWDPTYSNSNYWFYTLGVTGLIDAFFVSGTHTDVIPGLISKIERSQYSNGAVSYCYGANTGDEDWQSTSYAAMSLARADRAGHQGRISHMAYWIGATQDVSGGWKYSDDTHYPEMASECASALALGLAPSYVIVDDGFLSQADVDVYNTAHSTDYVFGYDAFGTIQAGVNAVSGSTVMVLPGTYLEQVEINKPVTLIGSGQGVTIVQSPVTLTKSFTTGAVNKPVIYVHDADGVTIQDLTIDGLGRGNTNYRFCGVAFYNAGGSLIKCEVKDIRETPISGGQHGIGVYGYVSALPDRTIDVSGCRIQGFQKGGITLNGTGLTAHVDSCRVVGYGPASFIAMNGIQIGFGATGLITSNSVSGCSYTGSGWASSGILIYSTTGYVISEGNFVSNCQIGINYLYNGGRISKDTVMATPSGTGLTSYWGIVADPGVGQSRQPAPQPFEDKMQRASVASPQFLITLVDQNVVDGGGSGTGIEADVYGTESMDLTVSGNSATHWEAGLVLYRDATASLSANVHDNVLISNQYGLYNWISTIDATGNTFTNGTNAVDGQPGNYYQGNCWSDFDGTLPYHVGGAGSNVDNNPQVQCGLCDCPYQGDINADGVIDVFDVVEEIQVTFVGAIPLQDPRCPKDRSDVNNDGVTDVFDVIYLIDTAFSGGPMPVDPCPL
jgi:hypothetical protein